MTLCFMSDQTAGNVLRDLRKRLRMTQTEFAERLGYTRATYKNWESGVGLSEKIVNQAKALVAQELGEPTIPASQLLIPVPYIGMVAASSSVDWGDPFDSEVFEFVPPEMGDAKGRFSCRVLGDSMYDLLFPGDLCVFQRTDVPKIGAVVIHRTTDNRVTIKQLTHDGRQFILKPVNAAYESEPASGSMVGYLVGIVRESGSKRVTVYDSTGIRP